MNQPSPVDSAFHKFLETLGERNSRDQRRRITVAEIVNAKDRKLIPMRQLLKRLRDMNLVVSNSARWTGGMTSTNLAPASFDVTEGPSSPRWLPGNSLYMDHPAELEIAIPNQKDQDEVGVVVITCATQHPDQDLLHGPFRDIRQACEALAEFIARNTEFTSDP